MNTVVAKFGGSSLASAAAFHVVRQRLREQPDCRVCVASAPGARFPGDAKVTDLLKAGDFAAVRARLGQIARPLGLDVPTLDEDQARRSAEFALSRGEWACARMLAQYLGWRFLDAEGLVLLDERRACRTEETLRRMRAALCDPDARVVIPGFSGSGPDGTILTLPRGGSDITGALAAAAVGASVYENYTDVCGVYTRDPALAPDAQPIARMSYRALRRAARQGARVMHEDAITPVEAADIPIHILSTLRPEAGGTWVDALAPD